MSISKQTLSNRRFVIPQISTDMIKRLQAAIGPIVYLITPWYDVNEFGSRNAVAIRMGPDRSLEPRAATAPGRVSATSTQAPPLLL